MRHIDYYRNPDVRARIIEYLGGQTLSEATCVYVSNGAHQTASQFMARPPAELGLLLASCSEIARSFWDRKSLIAHLDLEYVNFDFPADPYLDPERAFALQRPVERATEELLAGFGMRPLHIISGRGHHFVWRVPKTAPAYRRMQEVGRLPEHLAMYYSQPDFPAGESVEPELGAAYSGLGLVMEYVSHRLKKLADRESEVPVEVSAVTVPPQQRGREMVSIDITEYGDPLNTRSIAVPFGLYLKPWKKGGILHEGIKDRVPPMFPVPVHEMGVPEAIRVMRDPDETVRLAARTTASIPDQNRGLEAILDQYCRSDLARFHDWFYSQEHQPASQWPATYDRTPLGALPACTALILERPNDMLLKPAAIREVVRVMLSLGWHPRHIAGLIRSKFERDFGWGREWYVYDAATRADFYVRLFAGLVIAGLDDLSGFDCATAKDAQICTRPGETCTLTEVRESLRQRRKHGRLASRPFNRLFLPDEHI